MPVIIVPQKTFDTISRRILYGLNFMYSEFAPIESEKADARAQRKLHLLMGRVIDQVYATPQLLDLADNADEAYTWNALNNSDPALDKVGKSICRKLYDFYAFLYISFLRGEIRDKTLRVDKAALKENKIVYRPPFKALLEAVGIGVDKDGTGVTVTAGKDLLQSFRLLAEKVPVHENPWTRYTLVNFACCSFTGDFGFLTPRIDRVAGLNGLLCEIENKCLANGYGKSVKCILSPSGIGFHITLRHTVGGFVFAYHGQKYRPFSFGSLNSIGVKAMLEDFERLDPDLRNHLMNVCQPCKRCPGCVKGRGKHKPFAVNVSHQGREYTLCPDNFGRHHWETITPDLAAVLFKYNAAQEKYGVDRKKTGSAKNPGAKRKE